MTELSTFHRPRVPAALRGFTLIELMITITVAFVLMALALPSFRELTIRTNVTTNTNNLIVAINLARSEAAKRGVPVAVINAGSTAASWSSGWYVEASSLDTSLATPAMDFSGGTIYEVRAFGALAANYNVTSIATTTACSATCTSNGQIVFDATGALVGAAKVDLNVCRPDNNAVQENHVVISQAGIATSYRNTTGSPAPSC